MVIIYGVIHWIIQLLVLVVVIQAILSFFMAPYHPIRRTIDSIVNPFLNPIRRIMPQTGSLDFSPMVVIILLWFLDAILQRLLLSSG